MPTGGNLSFSINDGFGVEGPLFSHGKSNTSDSKAVKSNCPVARLVQEQAGQVMLLMRRDNEDRSKIEAH